MNTQSHHKGRRHFLKTAAVGTAGAMVCGLSCDLTKNDDNDDNKGEYPGMANVWKNGMKINPDIDNMRVVMVHDPLMVSKRPAKYNISGQNSNVDKSRVENNLDKMAMALAEPQSGKAKDAWSKIFRKPAAKNWSEVNAAIKINIIDPNDFPRLSILNKLMLVLIDLGVPAGNITIYDGSPASAGSQKIEVFNGSYAKSQLPAGYRVETWLGGETKVDLGGGISCCQSLADGTNDILINVGVNKGHSISSFTLSMKNHIGSLIGNHEDLSGIPFASRLVQINQSEAILGGSPARQQLCLIDALHSMKDGPYGKPTILSNAIMMGTFSPMVDYMCVKHIRENETLMGTKISHESAVYETFLKGFGINPNSNAVQNASPVNASTFAVKRSV